MYPNMPGYNMPTRVSKRMILDILANEFNASELVQADFETQYARHICPGGKHIILLPRFNYSIQIPWYGGIDVELIFCSNCRKLIVNRYSLDIL